MPLPLVGITPEPAVAVDMDALKAAICSALVIAGMNQKTAAAEIGVDPGHFARALASGQLPIGRMLRLGSGFWAAFLPQLAELANAAPDKSTPDVIRQSIAAIGELVAIATEGWKAS